MGERGPARQPAEIAKAKGTYQPSRHGDGSFAPAVKVPEPAGWWEPGCEVLAEWHRVTAELLPFGLVTEVDRAALIIYCEAWGTYQDMSSLIYEQGPILQDVKTLRMYPNPAVAMREKAQDAMLAVSKRFGFTPSDRTGIKATNTPKPQSEVDAWQTLKGGTA